MYDNLIKIGISEDTIKELQKKYDESFIEKLDLHYEDAFKIINALKAIKIEEIDRLIIGDIYFFFMDYDEFISKLRNKDLKEVSNRINALGPIALEEIFYEES